MKVTLLALALFAASVAPSAEPESRLLDLATQEFERGGYERSAELLQEVLEASPANNDARVKLGWCRYRQGRHEEALEIFRTALGYARASEDARVGVAYSLIWTDGPMAAAEEFRRVLTVNGDNVDALEGLVLAAMRGELRQDQFDDAIEAAARLVEMFPGDRSLAGKLEAFELKRGGWFERRLRRPGGGDGPIAVKARAGRDYLELAGEGGSWTPLFIKGINLGAALPGRFPTQFPRDEETYRAWLETMAGLGANTIRLYTLLPPEFYAALGAHNAAEGAHRIFLIQGVWTELPPGHDFSDAGYVAGLEAEIARVIDAVHGNLLVAHRPGHASGLYDTDVSSSLLAYIIGREWEPFAVKDYNALRPEITRFDGTWLRVENGNPMECWVARMCDFAAGYEANRYRMLHPLTFANWPTLDPLDHPTEGTRDEEDFWRRHYGLETHAALKEAPWEDDAVTVDSTKIRPTDAMRAGFFAAYHIYPNFPDFLNLQDSYGQGGPSRYARYLEDLKAYHGEQPVVVAEFGISTSRGIAHLQPEGLHHGGHDEDAQGRLVARMLREIHEARYAGGIIFEFMDEWFKGTWSVAKFEVPSERRRFWFNAESPEQSYGLLAARPGLAHSMTGPPGIRIDGHPGDWEEIDPLLEGRSRRRRARNGTGWSDLRKLRAISDEGFLYLLIETGGGPRPPDWGEVAFRIAIDTYAPLRGERELPPPGPVEVSTGVEFLIDVRGPGNSFVTVAGPYDPYRNESGPFVSPMPSDSPREEPRFARLIFESNRERFGRDGTRYPALTVDRGELTVGDGMGGRADVSVGARTGTIELRLPWSLLNVTDPSSHRVLHQAEPGDPPFDSVETDGFRIYAFTVDPVRPDRKPLDRMPPEGIRPRPYRWEGWDKPRFHLELKRGAAEIREQMNALPDLIQSSQVACTETEP